MILATVSGLALKLSTCLICSSLSFSNSKTSNWGDSPVRLEVDAFNSAFNMLRPSNASGKCSVRQVKIAFVPGVPTTFANSQKLLIIA